MAKECVSCMSDETETTLRETSCGAHHLCDGCLEQIFTLAIEDEKYYPPRCCSNTASLLLVSEFEQFLPSNVVAAFKDKEQGEYAILPRFRRYCADPACGRFLHPNSHIIDSTGSVEDRALVTYAICEAEDCFKATCIACRALLTDGTEGHVCEISESEKQFEETAKEKGYQICFACGRTIELAEACNHITCECGNSFCYVCGKDWQGLHGCPQYGPAEFDEDGFNQDGYHKDTGLNRDGLTRVQQLRRDRGEGEDEDGEEGEEEEDRDIDDELLQHLDPDARATLRNLNPEEREEALQSLRIMLLEEQGILFHQDAQHEGHGDSNSGEESEDGEHHDEDKNDDENDDEENGENENDVDDGYAEENGEEGNDFEGYGDENVEGANIGESGENNKVPDHDDAVSTEDESPNGVEEKPEFSGDEQGGD